MVRTIAPASIAPIGRRRRETHPAAAAASQPAARTTRAARGAATVRSASSAVSGLQRPSTARHRLVQPSRDPRRVREGGRAFVRDAQHRGGRRLAHRGHPPRRAGGEEGHQRPRDRAAVARSPGAAGEDDGDRGHRGQGHEVSPDGETRQRAEQDPSAAPRGGRRLEGLRRAGGQDEHGGEQDQGGGVQRRGQRGHEEDVRRRARDEQRGGNPRSRHRDLAQDAGEGDEGEGEERIGDPHRERGRAERGYERRRHPAVDRRAVRLAPHRGAAAGDARAIRPTIAVSPSTDARAAKAQNGARTAAARRRTARSDRALKRSRAASVQALACGTPALAQAAAAAQGAPGGAGDVAGGRGQGHRPLEDLLAARRTMRARSGA